MGLLTRLLDRLIGMAPRTVASQQPLYSAADVTRFTAGRDCFVVVRGNPFAPALDQKSFADAVVAAMQGQAWGPTTRFTWETPNAANPNHRIVMLFNGPRSARPADLCCRPEALDSVEPAGEAGRISVIAAWCREDAVLSDVMGWVNGASGPYDRAFTRFVAQVTRELFPVVFENPVLGDR